MIYKNQQYINWGNKLGFYKTLSGKKKIKMSWEKIIRPSRIKEKWGHSFTPTFKETDVKVKGTKKGYIPKSIKYWGIKEVFRIHDGFLSIYKTSQKEHKILKGNLIKKGMINNEI